MTETTQTLELISGLSPKGDQPNAIKELVSGLRDGEKHQTLLGVTGSGKTFSIANTISQVNRPALIMAPNKTLAAQLYSEMKELFPNNAVEYFVSYYDYYQPEAYVPASDTFIEKDAIVNDAIDRMRHSATRSLLSRRDVIIVASVSCIYGIGSAEWYLEMLIDLQVGQELMRDRLLKQLVDIQYQRNDIDFHRGTFRVRGDVVEIFPAHSENVAIRVEFFGDEIERITEVDPLRGVVTCEHERYGIYPGSHYVTPEEHRRRAIESIRVELQEQLQTLQQEEKLLERQRLEQRTMFDLEMLEQMGFCQGIENYTRHLSGRKPGEPPPTLMDYFPDDFVVIIDESHQTIPQIGAMFKGDRARKTTLVEHGFRLPSAIDNRPLQFDEWEERAGQRIYVSATPGDYELDKSEGIFVEQVIRPTGLMDPPIEVRPVRTQVDDLLGEVRKRIERNERVLVTTLTKRMAEDLTEYYSELGLKVRYLHSDIDTIERVEILRDLRKGVFDVLVGINLLREGLDLPEVSLVGILDADKEGFLRSPRSLIQTIGRAARNSEGRVIMYADRITNAMNVAMEETKRRRKIQADYNEEHGIVPETVRKAIMDLDPSFGVSDYTNVAPEVDESASVEERVASMKTQMLQAAEELDFERAASLRDEIRKLTGEPAQSKPARQKRGGGSNKKKRTRR